MGINRAMGRTVLAAAICMGALAVTATSASAATSLAISGAKLLTKGAAVDVSLSVSCDPLPSTPSPLNGVGLSVEISQVVKDMVTEGVAGTSTIVCDGTAHAVDIFVIPQQGQVTLPFARDEAFVQAALEVCTETGGCRTVNQATTIPIT